MSRKEIKKQLLHYEKEAQAQAENACALCAVPGDEERKREFLLCVHRYVCAKYFLPPESSCERLLIHLAEDSIEQAIRMKISFAKDSEMAVTCGAAGSAAMKVALLMLAIQKDFHVSIAPEKLAFIKNTQELGEILYSVQCEGTRCL